MQISPCENFLAVISGKNLIMKEQKANQLFVFKRHEGHNFNLHKRIVVKEIPIMNKVCMQFYFERTDKGKEPNSLIFVKQDRIIKLNFDTDEISTTYEFKDPLGR